MGNPRGQEEGKVRAACGGAALSLSHDEDSQSASAGGSCSVSRAGGGSVFALFSFVFSFSFPKGLVKVLSRGWERHFYGIPEAACSR